jgi:phosphoglycerate dehydrogenase-like enzyme
LTETTKGLIGAEQFSQMKPTAILVNAARGAVVNTEALALRSSPVRSGMLP